MTGSANGSFDEALQLGFPLHYPGSAVTLLLQPARLPWDSSATLPLALDDAQTASDRLPWFTPTTTEAAVRVALQSILSTLTRERIKAVGIFATDNRDFLFLAREVRRVAPDVLLFTTEPHIIFLHPDYRSFVRGTLVAASYPLFARTLELFSASQSRKPFNRKEQFQSMASEGASTRSCFSCDGASGIRAARVADQAAR